MKKRTLMKWGAGIAVLFLLAQIVTYVLWAEEAMPRTATKTLPQFTHFQSDTRFDFACLSDDSLRALSANQREALLRALQPHFATIYEGEAAMPEGRWPRNKAGRRVPLPGGCLLEWRVRHSWPFWFSSRYADWEGALAATEGNCTFVWLLGYWLRVLHVRGPVW